MAGNAAHVVAVEVSTGWTSPEAPRDIDALAVAAAPDVRGWLEVLDAQGPDGRFELHGRTLTQLVAGEPVELIDETGDWARVVAPWQPSPLDGRGYPMWVPRTHLTTGAGAATPSSDGIGADRLAICEAARRHLGLPYLWGGTTPYGLDCSGLVHYSYRQAGVVVPRDAAAQHAAASPVPLAATQPGDLYFFAKPDGRVYHVGFCTGENTMLHAPETGRLIEDAPMAPQRLASIFAAGRFLA